MADIKAWIIDIQKEEAVTSIYDVVQISKYPKSVIEYYLISDLAYYVEYASLIFFVGEY